MSTKCTIKYCKTDNFSFHLYNCFRKGYQFSIKVGNMKEAITLDLSEDEAKDISEQLTET